MESRKTVTALLLTASIGASFSLATVSAFAEEKGKSKGIAELSADWWQWQEINFGVGNFDFGDGLVDCGVGQKGNVWFLGGTNFAGPYNRACMDVVPAGKRLFFPIINVVIWDEPFTPDERRELAKDTVGDSGPGYFGLDACYLDVTVDGEPVIFSGTAIQRVQSPLFEYDEDPEAVSDGYWVLLPKLSGGDHTVRFIGSFCVTGTGDPVVDADVTYELTVAGGDN